MPLTLTRVAALVWVVALVGMAGACVDLTRPASLAGSKQLNADGADGAKGPNDDLGASDSFADDALGGSGSGDDTATGEGDVAGAATEAGSVGDAGVTDAPAVIDAIADAVSVADVPVEAPPPKLPNGVTCQQGAQCTSGFCTDGVCCESACAGICRSCAIAGAQGTCRAAAAGSDPRNSCPDDGATSCGRTGACDGAQACQRYAATTVCAPLACASTGQVTLSRCNGAGACVAAPPQSCYPFACVSATSGTCRTSCASQSDCAAPASCFGNVCGGILGTYFASPDLTGRFVTRLDREVSFTWNFNAPIATIPADQFSVRWTGQLTPRFSEPTTFYVRSDDGLRLWIDNRLIIDDWRVRSTGAIEVSAVIALVAAKAVSLRLEYLENNADASVVLSWSSASQPKQVIPVTVLAP